MISQGRVEEIVHSKPRDRRLLIEEAAGLGKHRKRRRRAQLKLERTQDNLDRALDVEREARSRLRPLKRQAEAADLHARLEREAAELRARLLASELHGQDDELAGAERAATSRARRAREARREAGRGRPPAARRSRSAVAHARARAHRGVGPADRGPRRPRADQRPRRGARRAPCRACCARSSAAARRSARWPTSSPPPTGARAGDDPVAAGLERIGEALGAAVDALDEARGAGDDGEPRAPRLAAVRAAPSAPRRWRRRVEELLGNRAQDSLEERLERESDLVAALGELCEVAADARDAAGERAAALEARMLGESGERRRSPTQLRACSREEAELQAQLRAAAEAVTEAEVRVAHLGDRRGEAAAELARIAARLGRELEAAEATLGAEERAEIERKLERLAPAPRAARPGQPARRARVRGGARPRREPRDAAQRPRDRAAELQGLIRDTDRKIHAAFEETFEATSDELRGADRAPLPGRPRAAAPGRRPSRPAAGPRRRRIGRCRA